LQRCRIIALRRCRIIALQRCRMIALQRCRIIALQRCAQSNRTTQRCARSEATLCGKATVCLLLVRLAGVSLVDEQTRARPD
jgi:hypothetical protein